MAQTPQVVILCGGKGTRLRERTEAIPKPMVEVGDMPILWHIMKIYAHYGFKDFVLCLGYKGEAIRQFFIQYGRWQKQDFVLDSHQIRYFGNGKDDIEDWRISFVDTGQETNTGGRIKRVEKHVRSSQFFVTYGDGVSDIDIKRLLSYHQSHKKTGTVTCVKPRLQFGMVDMDANKTVTAYEEKPVSKRWASGGFFVFNKEIFRHINEDDILETTVINRLVARRELRAYCFEGYWECMDTYKDHQKLNDLWALKKAPWKLWK